MRLEKIQKFLQQKSLEFTYTEQEGLGSIDFEYRGVEYHIWEFFEGTYGAESNVRNGGRQEDFWGDYEADILKVFEDWKL